VIVTIRARLMWLVGIALLPAIAILGHDQYRFRQQVLRDIQANAERVASLVGTQIQAQIDDSGRRCGLLTRLPDIQGMDAAASQTLAVILRESPRFANLAIADANGRLTASALPLPGEVSIAERDFFARVLATAGVAAGVFHPNPVSSRQGLDVGCPLFDSKGAVRGVIWITLGLEWTTDFVARSNLPPDAVLLVFDAEGIVVTRSIDPAQWTGRRVYSAATFHEMRRSRVGAATVTGADGVERLFALSWVTDSGGNLVAAAAVGIPTRTANAAAWASFVRNLGILLAGALACLGLAWLAADRLFLRDTRALLGTARALKAGNVSARTGISEGAGELRDVARALDAGLEAVARQLRVAREIQMGFLPVSLAAATRGTPLDVQAVIEPARKVGGDLYEVLRAADDRVVVALGDVSGKGFPAALFMAVAVTVLRTLARSIADPAEILKRLNDELTEQNPRGMFVTIQCLVFDLTAKRVTVAGAGHHQLVFLSPGQPPRLAFPSSGRPAGLMPFNPIASESMPLNPGDMFVLFSDGVSEAMNAEDHFFGEERLLAHLGVSPDATPAEIVEDTLQAVRDFAGAAPQSDDITILAARYA
jgi:serine phosphatase RsbU (regulator of sigma subunit)